jgi:threonine dehydrogenase-like Zn-dependent dehydrogenase
MRAAVVAAPGKARLKQVPAPVPGPGQILLRVEGCGVCGSNLPVWTGNAAAYPLRPGAPGHEAWGRIEVVGEGVTGVTVGERVAALTFNSFAEYDIASADAVVPLPEELEGTPVPAEALACAVNVFRRSDVLPGSSVGIVGIGFLGALLTQLAAAAGARVIAFQETLDLASRLTRTRGRLVVAGFHQDGPRQVDMGLWNWRGLDVVNAHERDPAVYVDGMREAIRAVADGRLTPDPLYTHTFPLERLADAFEAARAREDGFMKGLVLV